MPITAYCQNFRISIEILIVSVNEINKTVKIFWLDIRHHTYWVKV